MAFLHPFVLLGLLALPILWWLLRFLPPSPKKIFLPTARFFNALPPHDTTPDTSPWWLLVLRLLILACLIFAFAGPILNRQKTPSVSGPLRLVMDNGWGSAQTWNLQKAKAEEILHRAAAQNRAVELQFTASSDKGKPVMLRADEALGKINSASPQPWAGNADHLDTSRNIETFWISTGLAEDGFQANSAHFENNGDLTLFVPDIRQRPGILRGASENQEKSIARIEIPAGSGEKTLTLQALDEKSRTVAQITSSVTGQSGGMDVNDEQGIFAKAKISRLKLPAFAGAGGIFLKDVGKAGGVIGIPAAATQTGTANYSDASFYLSRAADKFAKIETGTIEELIAKNSTVILLPDIAEFSPATLDALGKWVNEGGILLRFGGKRMSEAQNILIPVPLKTGLRSLSGDMTWTTPIKLAPFPEKSPFAGQPIPDVTVERQLLAEPSPDLSSHIWAQLSDGTPFITAREEGRGMIVLVHTTATPDWSDFVLSGFYISFLKEMTEMAAMPDKSISASSVLQPLLVLDGWGQLVKPDSEVKPIDRKDLNKLVLSPEHPPGYYGDATQKITINLGDHVGNLELIDNVPAGAEIQSLSEDMIERNMSPYLFTAAAFLFLIDWLLLIYMQGITRRWGMIAALLIFTISPAHAETDISRASIIHLACVKSSQDQLCLTALNKISAELRARTSVETGNAVIVDPAKDDLSFYPLLYWPIDATQQMDADARSRLSYYLSHGGMIMIDTQDGSYDSVNIMASPNVRHMRELMQGIDIPSLKPAPRDFVLFKSFYLLNIRPEYDLEGKFWVEEDALPPEEDLSSVLITGEDWLHRWAYPSDPVAEEMANRFGINMVMYALTGNYKSDQIHMKAILQRMGE